MVQHPSIATCVNKLSPNPDSMVLEKDKPRKSNSEGENNLDFRAVKSMVTLYIYFRYNIPQL
jgi:hypothetical protein